MAKWWMGGAIALVGLIALMTWIASWTDRAQAQDTEDLAALNRGVIQLYRTGKYGEGIELANRSLVFRL